jgi:hypothetical protein
MLTLLYMLHPTRSGNPNQEPTKGSCTTLCDLARQQRHFEPRFKHLSLLTVTVLFNTVMSECASYH